MWIILIFISVLILHVYLKILDGYKFWKRKGIPFINPWFFFGNLAPVAFRTRAMVYVIQDLYEAFPDKRYVGIYAFLKPTLLIRDPELIKKITVKDFDSFPDRSEISSKEADPLVSKNLISLTMKEGWHDMRTKVSPSFSVCKMKAMFALMDNCANQFVNHFDKQNSTLTIDIKEAFTKFTNDLIASTAFGINCNSLEDPKNDFYLMSMDLGNFEGIRTLKFFGYSVSPLMMKLLKISTFSRISCEFFSRIVKESLKIREEKQIVRPDMIYLLMEAKKKCLKSEENELLNSNLQKKDILKITDDDIVAQALGFFFAGYDATSTLMSYIAYELALNRTIQRKLREEIDTTLKSCDEKLTYEVLTGMRYLDKVISETLRKWPPEFIVDRRSQRPFTIEAEKPEETLLYLESGSVCWIPIFSIHRDPKYYPNPGKFDPERFSEHNKHAIKPFTYLPFGSGPRSCVGSRFAVLETKLIIVRLLQRFEIVPVQKTQIPITVNKRGFSLIPEGGFWLGLKPRLSCS